MADTTTPLLKLRNQEEGTNDDSWGEKADVNLEFIEQAIAGVATINMAGSGTRSLSDSDFVESESRKAILRLTGLLAGAHALTIPARTRLYYIKNGTTGDFPVTVGPLGTTGVEVAQGSWSTVFCDGTDAELVVLSLGDINKVEVLSQAAYNALSVKLNTTVYLVPIG